MGREYQTEFFDETAFEKAASSLIASSSHTITPANYGTLVVAFYHGIMIIPMLSGLPTFLLSISGVFGE